MRNQKEKIIIRINDYLSICIEHRNLPVSYMLHFIFCFIRSRFLLSLNRLKKISGLRNTTVFPLLQFCRKKQVDLSYNLCSVHVVWVTWQHIIDTYRNRRLYLFCLYCVSTNLNWISTCQKVHNAGVKLNGEKTG